MTACGRFGFSGAWPSAFGRAALRPCAPRPYTPQPCTLRLYALYAQASSVATCAPAHLPVTMASQLFQPPL